MARRAVKEYLATLDDTAWQAASAVVPKFVSPSDPAALWTGAQTCARFPEALLVPFFLEAKVFAASNALNAAPVVST